MKRTASVLILTFAASAAWAQAAGAASHVTGGVRGNVGQPTGQSAGVRSGGTGSAAASGSAGANAAAPIQTFNGSLGEAARKVATPPVRTSVPPKPAKPVAKKPARPATTAAAASATSAPAAVPAKAPLSGKRDPFVSPIVSRVSGPVGCSGGKKCLVIDQIALKGVVKAPNGMIAVIENSGRKAYFMRENDPVYNGFVVKITTDSIVFRETITDRIGRTSTRDVVKRVTAPAV